MTGLLQNNLLLRPTSFQLAKTLGATAAWEFTEATGDAIDDIGSNDGTITGTAQGAAAIHATSGGSYDFDGTGDVVEVTKHADIDNIFDGGGSIELWVDIDSDGQGNSGRIIEKRSPSGLLGWSLWTETESGGNVALAFRHDRATDGEWTSAVDIAINTVHHLVLTYDKDDATNDPILYVNAVARTEGSGLTESPEAAGSAKDDSSKDLHIGNQDGLGSSFDGQISGVHLYKTILTAAQVTSLYEAGKG